MAWKDPMWEALAKEMNLTECTAVYGPVFTVAERNDLTKSSTMVYLEEPNKLQLQGVLRTPFDSHNPFPAPVVVSRQIFKTKDRSCLHMEFDLTGSCLCYHTGDHVSIMPVNSGIEVDRFLRVFGLESKCDTVIDVKAIERTVRVAFPVPTTYDTIVRYRLEIGAPVSRQFIQQLSSYAPTSDTKAEMEKLGADKDYSHNQLTERQLNIPQALELVAKGAPWEKVPFSMLLESLLALKLRIYSISSSSLAMKDRLTITTKVETHPIASTNLFFKGVATNYLLALEQKQNNVSDQDPYAGTYTVHSPRKHYDGLRASLYIRPSTFRLPNSSTTPIIMVGPGTGVAPFRAFVQERAEQKKSGHAIGLTMLFFGCRNQKEDFIYEEEWASAGKKVYVQDKIRLFGAEISSLLTEDAHLYVCGDASMAKNVSGLLQHILSEQRAVSLAEAAAIIKQMRAANPYQEDAWS
ncbi:NADPH-ferrihemoprotein reductase [Cladophialophora psammophila CBS 110553]|uniref:NADPH--hemoprotein reductase n=1 Tax=Cladophialophora psammophila CBS 110553 TaxID=1182543 RepID=W9WYD6_9EURO|nr:NADPH-ferrihemoprotein reductase [Cladophialophora psammophila CBS 110553]EXJ63264.1 NADPH-ferrihemoprotein reductase [Cladophialophora psammophila CBS 110553]